MFKRFFQHCGPGLVLTLVLLCSSFCAVAQNKYEDSYNYKRGLEALNDKDYSTGIEYLNKEVASHKDNGYAYFYLAITHSYNDDYGRALSSINNALKYLPKKDKETVAYAYKIRADIYDEIDQPDKALSDYSTAVKTYPKEPKLLEARASYLYGQGKFDESDADFNQMLKLDPDNVVARIGLGRNCVAKEDYQKAVDYFDYVTALYPDYSMAYAFRAEAYHGLNDKISAASDVVTALGLDGNNKALYLLTQYAEDSYAELTTRLKAKTVLEKNNHVWPYCLGIVNEAAKKFELAIDNYKKCNSMEPDALLAYRISTCYSELGNWKQALDYIDKAIEMEPDDIDYISAKAELYWNSDDLDAAIAEMSKCVEAEPENYIYYHHRGWYNEHAGDLDGALEDYNTAIILEPKEAYNYMTRGRIYRAKGEDELAKQDFTTCVQLDTIPESGSCAEYAWLYLGEEDKAIEFMNKLLEDDAKGNFYNAACLYSIMDRKEEALDYLRKALEAGFNSFAHMRRDDDLDNIRDMEEYKSLIEQYSGKLNASIEESDDAGGWVEKVVEVPFTRSGGVTKVKCEINGLPLSFIFDTGASAVSISSLEATFMYKNDYLSAKDIVGKAAFMDANGDISIGTVINLNKVAFGGLELDNVRATVVSNDKAPLLLGQTVLSRLGKVEIDNEKSVLRITTREMVEK